MLNPYLFKTSVRTSILLGGNIYKHQHLTINFYFINQPRTLNHLCSRAFVICCWEIPNFLILIFALSIVLVIRVFSPSRSCLLSNKIYRSMACLYFLPELLPLQFTLKKICFFLTLLPILLYVTMYKGYFSPLFQSCRLRL